MEELICSHESALHVYKNPYEIEREMEIPLSSVRRIAKHDLKLKIYKRLPGLLSLQKCKITPRVLLVKVYALLPVVVLRPTSAVIDNCNTLNLKNNLKAS